MKLEYTYEESDFDIHSLDYDKNHGKSFRWAKTPKDQDQPATFSLVTPYNGELQGVENVMMFETKQELTDIIKQFSLSRIFSV